MKNLIRLILVFLLALLVPSHSAFAQAGYVVTVNVAPVTIDGDTLSLQALHSTVGDQDVRLLRLTVTPAAGSPVHFLAINVGDVQSFVSATTTILSVINQNGTPITVSGQTQLMSLDVVEIRPTPTFLMVQNGSVPTYEVQIHQSVVQPYFFRNYSATSLQQFAAYLNLGVSFANALP
jgi:hypothetical protein